MVLWLLTHFLTPSHPPLIAFSARFYYAPGDKRLSHSHIYLCNLDGSNRHQLTFGSEDEGTAYWTGHNTVAWIEAAGTPNNRFVEYDLRTRKRRTIAKGGWESKPNESRIVVRSEPIEAEDSGFKDDQFVFRWTVAGADIRWDKSRHGRKLPKQYLENNEDIDSNRSIILTRGLDDFDLGITEEPNIFWESHSPNKCWLEAGWRYRGASFWIFEIDWKHKTARPVIKNVDRIDFGGDLGTWAAMEGGRPLSKLGKMQVWTHKLYAGDIRTGRQWTIADGVVDGWDPAVQPPVR